MDKEQLLFEIEKNIKDFKQIEEMKSMLMLAIYEKNIEKIKNEKIEEVKEYLNNQVNYYEQSSLEYQTQIDLTIKEYKKQIEQLVGAYNYLYENTYKSMQKAINNQVIAIGNIVTLWNKKNQKSGDDLNKINKQLMAVVQKKVNYSVIVEECKARLNWCIENSRKRY